MIITSTEHDASSESRDPAELLIKEARRKARRRRLTFGVILLAAVLVVVVLSVATGGGHPRPKSTPSDTAPRSVTSLAPKCNILNLNEAYGGTVAGDGVTYDIIKFTNEKTTCVVGRVTLQGINLNASQHKVGPSTSNKPASVTLKDAQSVYLPVGVVDTNGFPPLEKCNAAEITGIQIHFPWDRKYFDNAYVGFGAQKVCTSRVSLTVAPYQPKA